MLSPERDNSLGTTSSVMSSMYYSDRRQRVHKNHTVPILKLSAEEQACKAVMDAMEQILVKSVVHRLTRQCLQTRQPLGSIASNNSKMSSNSPRPQLKLFTKMSQASCPDRRGLNNLTLLGTDDITVDDDDQLSAESFDEDIAQDKSFLAQSPKRGYLTKNKTSALETEQHSPHLKRFQTDRER